MRANRGRFHFLPHSPSRSPRWRGVAARLCRSRNCLPRPTRPRRSTRPSAKSIIFLHQWGGPGQHETFGPGLTPRITSAGGTAPPKTKLPGVIFGEKIPKLAAMADKFTVVRCMQHSMKNHNSAGYYSLTGGARHRRPAMRDSIDPFPAYGSIVDKLSPRAEGRAPRSSRSRTSSRTAPSRPGSTRASSGKAHAPLFVNQDPSRSDFKLPELTLPESLSVERLESRKDILKLIDEQSDLLENSLVAQGLDESYQKAVVMLTSPRFKQAFDLFHAYAQEK